MTETQYRDALARNGFRLDYGSLQAIRDEQLGTSRMYAMDSWWMRAKRRQRLAALLHDRERDIADRERRIKAAEEKRRALAATLGVDADTGACLSPPLGVLAAVTDMLAALKAAAGHLGETRKDPKWHPIGECPVLDQVRRAIAKAEQS